MPSSHRRSGVVILVLTLSLAGCGSGDATGTATPMPAAPKGADPVAWMGAFCGAPNGLVNAAAAMGKIVGKEQPTPQKQRDGLLVFAESYQQAMADTARKLEQLGPPAIADGKRVHDTAVSYFKSTAESIAGTRAKLAELDPNGPGYRQELSSLAAGDLGAISTQLQQVTSSNQELTRAFHASPECQRLGSGIAPR